MHKNEEVKHLESKELEADFKKYMYHPMRDKVFAGLLLDNKLCEEVINAVTGVNFITHEIHPQYYEPGELHLGRAIILDIKAVDPGGAVCNIEVQVNYFPGGAHEKRIVFHAGRLLSKQLKTGEDFINVRPVYIIFFNFESASNVFIKHINLKDESGLVYSDILQIYEINTMENEKATPDQLFIKIFSLFL